MRRSVFALSLAGGLLGAVAVDTVLQPLHGDGVLREAWAVWGTLGIVVACTTLLLWLALRVALRETEAVRARTFMSCTLFGWLNCPVSLVVAAVTLGPFIPYGPAVEDLFAVMIFAGILGAILGLFVAIPIGMLYGLVAIYPAVRLRRLMSRPSHDAAARARWTVGITVTVASAIGAIVAAGNGIFGVTHVAPPIPLALMLVGIGLAISGWRAIRRHARLEEAIRAGALEGWERVPIDELGEAAEALLPLSGEVSDQPGHALVRLLPSRGRGAYRTASPRVPWALVD